MSLKKYILISFTGCLFFSCSSMDTKNISSREGNSNVSSFFGVKFLKSKLKRKPAQVGDSLGDVLENQSNDIVKTSRTCLAQRESEIIVFTLMSNHTNIVNRNPQKIFNMLNTQLDKDKFRDYLRTGNYSARDTCSGASEGLMSGVSLYFERRQNKSTYFDPIANIAGASSFDVDTFINGIREKIASCSRPYENPENVLRNIDWLIRQPGLALWSRDAENRVVVKFLDGTYDGSGDRDRYCRHYLAAIIRGLSFHKILEETETN